MPYVPATKCPSYVRTIAKPVSKVPVFHVKFLQILKLARELKCRYKEQDAFVVLTFKPGMWIRISSMWIRIQAFSCMRIGIRIRSVNCIYFEKLKCLA